MPEKYIKLTFLIDDITFSCVNGYRLRSEYGYWGRYQPTNITPRDVVVNRFKSNRTGCVNLTLIISVYNLLFRVNHLPARVVLNQSDKNELASSV